jgi:hypothetical protein
MATISILLPTGDSQLPPTNTPQHRSYGRGSIIRTMIHGAVKGGYLSHHRHDCRNIGPASTKRLTRLLRKPGWIGCGKRRFTATWRRSMAAKGDWRRLCGGSVIEIDRLFPRTLRVFGIQIASSVGGRPPSNYCHARSSGASTRSFSP